MFRNNIYLCNFFKWGFLFNTSLLFTLITLDLYSYQIKYHYPNIQMTYVYSIILFVTTLENVIVKIKFIHSEENIENIFAKNLSNGTFHSLTSRYIYRE